MEEENVDKTFFWPCPAGFNLSGLIISKRRYKKAIENQCLTVSRLVVEHIK